MDTESALNTPSLAALFAEDFDQTSEAEQEPEVIPPVFTAAELDEARADARNEGRDAGFVEATARHEAALGQAAESLAAQLAAIHADIRQHAEYHAMMVARLLLDTLAALFPALCARHGPEEARALCNAVLPGILDEPRITFSAHPAWAPLLAQHVEELDPQLAARTKIVTAESMVPGDVRIVWSHGSASRDAAGLWQRVADILVEAGVLTPEPTGKELKNAA